MSNQLSALRSVLAFATLLLLPLGTQAATVTYGFTGTVTSTVGGVYNGASLVGDSVTGSFSFNTDNIDPSAPNSVGILGSTTSNWEGAEQTGSSYGTTPSPAYVFSSFIDLNGGFAYQTTSPGSYASSSYIQGANGGTYFAAGESQVTPSSQSMESVGSGFILSQAGPAFGSDGLPLFAAGASSNDSGQYGTSLYSCVNNQCGWTPIAQVNFQITDLERLTPAPVPLPAAAWLLLSGLGGLAAFARKRKTA